MRDWPAILASIAIVATIPATVIWLVSSLTFLQAWAITTVILVLIGVIDR